MTVPGKARDSVTTGHGLFAFESGTMNITETIQLNAKLSTLAAAADWAAVVAAWPVVRLPDVRVSGRQTVVSNIRANSGGEAN